MSDDVAAPVFLDIPEGYQVLDWRRGFGRQVGPLYIRPASPAPVMAFRVEDHQVNGMRNAHGGMLMTFADMAWGQIVSVETSSYWATVRLSCDFLASAKIGDWVEGQGELMSSEDELFIVRGRVWSGERTLMTGTGLFKPTGPREPRPGEKAYVAPTK